MFKSSITALSAIPDLRITENEFMSNHTSFKIGGPARLFLEAFTKEAVIKALDILKSSDITPLIIGNGSNLLVSDSGYNGVVLKISANKIKVSDNYIYAEAGALLSSIASVAQKNALQGFEFAHGIPGTLGGAVVMNAGAYGGEICSVLYKSECASPDGIIEISNEEHFFGYRASIYKQHPEYTVLSATLKLEAGNPDCISAKMRELAEKRRDKQPLEFPSAGSVFKRPVGYFAGALIEQCGLKGYSIGGAEVSKKHAGFIINRGGATADDVKKLVDHIQNVVLKETGVSLECEICFI